MSNLQEGRRLKEDDLVGLTGGTELAEVPLDGGDVGDKRVYNFRPGFVQCGIPDGGREGLGVERGGHLAEFVVFLTEDLVTLVVRDQVHLVDEIENLGVGRVLLKCV